MAEAEKPWDPLDYQMPEQSQRRLPVQLVPQGHDADLFVEFFEQDIVDDWGMREKALDDSATVKLPTTELCVRIQARGNTRNILCRKVKLQGDHFGPSDLERFPRQWAQYQARKRGDEGAAELGMPLSELGVSKSHMEALKASRIMTVEDVANVSDQNAPSLGLGFWSLREKARKLLQARKIELQERQQQANETRDDRIEGLEKRFDRLESMILQLGGNATPKRGRPRKDAAEEVVPPPPDEPVQA